jgi:hypothetical protein
VRLVWGEVVSVLCSGENVQRLEVALDDGTYGSAVAYPRLAGRCDAGDRVLVNTTAVDLRLGTGGDHYVVANGRDPRGIALDAPSGGHVMKLRYSPLQFDVLAVEAQESPHHAQMREAESLLGMPVVCCGLHSQAPLVAAAVKAHDPSARVVYVMTDSASLALPMSRLEDAALSAGLFDTTVTSGQAFGGEFEAVNLHSALLAAHHVMRATVAIVAPGPGIVGTATPFGHAGVAQGEALNAVACLSGAPVACLRISFADARERHRVVSHHTMAALTRISLAPALVAVPQLPVEQSQSVDRALEEAGVWARHSRAESRLAEGESPDLRGVRVTTMGRDAEADPAFFAAAFAAGDVAAREASTSPGT